MLRSYKSSVIFLFAILIISSVIGVTATYYYRSTEAVINLSDEIIDGISDKVINKVSVLVGSTASHIKLAAVIASQRTIVQHKDEILQYLLLQIKLSRHLQSIYFGDKDGNFIQARKLPRIVTRVITRKERVATLNEVYFNEDYQQIADIKKPTDYDPRKRQWYVNAGTEPRVSWSGIYRFHTSQYGITASYPIMDFKGNVVAVVAADFSLELIASFLSEQKVSNNGVALIIDSQHQVVASPNGLKKYGEGSTAVSRILPLITEFDVDWVKDAYLAHKNLQNVTSSLAFSKTLGDSYISKIDNFPVNFGKQWKLMLVIPQSDILGSVDRMLLESLVISAIILVIAIFIVYMMAGKFSDPIARLAANTNRITNFQLDSVEDVKSRFSEIQLMNDSIIQMKNGLIAFEKYVPSEVVHQLIETGKEAKLGGDSLEVTLFFSQITGFAKIVRAMPTEELMLFLSEYLDELSKAVIYEKGTIDKYVGDAIIAFWGAPVELLEHASFACRAALRCEEILTELNRQWEHAGKPTIVNRIGIHTGISMVGNIGAKNRMNYTVIGENVNICSHLEQLNKTYGTKIIISDATYALVQSQFECRLLDVINIKYVEKEMRIYELLAERQHTLSAEKALFNRHYGECFQHYLDKNWDLALTALEKLNAECPDEKSVKNLIKRCKMSRAGKRRRSNDKASGSENPKESS